MRFGICIVSSYLVCYKIAKVGGFLFESYDGVGVYSVGPGADSPMIEFVVSAIDRCSKRWETL